MKPFVKFRQVRFSAALVVLVASFTGINSALSNDGALPDGDEVARLINARDDGRLSSRQIVMHLRDKSGKTRSRVTRSYRKDFGEERRIAIYFDKPRNLKGTAFLTYDYSEQSADDDQWLYLPALRKTRRVAGAERGDSFMGTDFSYDDIKQETKVSEHEYTRKNLGVEELGGLRMYKIEAIPINGQIAEELGYSRVLSWVDPQIWMVRKSQFWDTHGNLLKTVHFRDIRQIDGIWTPHELEVENHSTGHQTLFAVSEVDYESGLSNSVFRRETLGRGAL